MFVCTYLCVNMHLRFALSSTKDTARIMEEIELSILFLLFILLSNVLTEQNCGYKTIILGTKSLAEGKKELVLCIYRK